MIDPTKLIKALLKKKQPTMYSSWQVGRNKGIQESIEVVEMLSAEENHDVADGFPNMEFPGFTNQAYGS